MLDLNEHLVSIGWVLNEARDINDAGQIVGLGRLHGSPRAFLVTPTSRAPPPPLKTSDLPRWEALLHNVFEIIQGGGGLATTPSGSPIPVPPHEPAISALSAEQQDVMLGVALTSSAEHIDDPRARADVTRTGLRLARRARERLENVKDGPES